MNTIKTAAAAATLLATTSLGASPQSHDNLRHHFTQGMTNAINKQKKMDAAATYDQRLGAYKECISAEKISTAFNRDVVPAVNILARLPGTPLKTDVVFEKNGEIKIQISQDTPFVITVKRAHLGYGKRHEAGTIIIQDSSITGDNEHLKRISNIKDSIIHIPASDLKHSHVVGNGAPEIAALLGAWAGRVMPERVAVTQKPAVSSGTKSLEELPPIVCGIMPEAP